MLPFEVRSEKVVLVDFVVASVTELAAVKSSHMYSRVDGLCQRGHGFTVTGFIS